MNSEYIRERISALRMQMGISEYKMSLDLGHSKSYIQSISSGKALPSLAEFLYICEYLNVTPMEFFDTKSPCPQSLHELMDIAGELSADDLSLLIQFAKRLRS